MHRLRERRQIGTLSLHSPQGRLQGRSVASNVVQFYCHHRFSQIKKIHTSFQGEHKNKLARIKYSTRRTSSPYCCGNAEQVPYNTVREDIAEGMILSQVHKAASMHVAKIWGGGGEEQRRPASWEDAKWVWSFAGTRWAPDRQICTEQWFESWTLSAPSGAAAWQEHPLSVKRKGKKII